MLFLCRIQMYNSIRTRHVGGNLPDKEKSNKASQLCGLHPDNSHSVFDYANVRLSRLVLRHPGEVTATTSMHRNIPFTINVCRGFTGCVSYFKMSAVKTNASLHDLTKFHSRIPVVWHNIAYITNGWRQWCVPLSSTCQGCILPAQPDFPHSFGPDLAPTVIRPTCCLELWHSGGPPLFTRSGPQVSHSQTKVPKGWPKLVSCYLGLLHLAESKVFKAQRFFVIFGPHLLFYKWATRRPEVPRHRLKCPPPPPLVIRPRSFICIYTHVHEEQLGFKKTPRSP